MKKLFFASALAIVAVGGTLSANAISFYAESSSDEIICDTPVQLTGCDELPTNVTYYTQPNSQGDIVPYSTFQDLYRQN